MVYYLGRVPDDEGLCVARGEGDSGLCDSHFSSWNLGCVSTDEVVHDLLLGQLGHRGKDSESIASEQHNVLGVTYFYD